MGNKQLQYINFEDMQIAIKKPEMYLIINTMSNIKQDCVILNTIDINKEELIINNYIHKNKSIYIIIYGENNLDDTAKQKYNQLLSIGFHNIYIYSGGLFEWLLLQDIFGVELFPTNKKELDFFKFKTHSKLHVALLDN